MKLKRHQSKNYICDNCGCIYQHIDMYNDKYCYECIDINTGELDPKKTLQDYGVKV